MLRIGIGYDLHRLVENRPLILGGEIIPFSHGLEGHSDADVLVHALMDALPARQAWVTSGAIFHPGRAAIATFPARRCCDSEKLS